MKKAILVTENQDRPKTSLVLQGGGSLGAFACGVFKTLVKKEIRIDIAAWHIDGSH